MKLKYHSPIAYPVTRSNRYVAAGTPTPFIVSLGESKGERVLYLPVSSNTPSIFLLFQMSRIYLGSVNEEETSRQSDLTTMFIPPQLKLDQAQKVLPHFSSLPYRFLLLAASLSYCGFCGSIWQRA